MELTDRQLDVMRILWDEGSATVNEAQEQMDADLAYTSILTVFQTLEDNGKIEHEQEGKAYRYYPTVSREEVGAKAAYYVLRQVFGISPSSFLSAMADDAELSEARRDLLQRMVGE